MSRVVLHYSDDGPSGPCGQCMSVTAPWSRIYIYEGETAEADADAYATFLRSNSIGRRNPRIGAAWVEDDGHVHDGPIVPADLRLGG